MTERSDTPDVASPEDGTLGGYIRVHQRPPAFEGLDGYPYTVSMEVERTPDLRTPHHGYLVFPRWAETGIGVVGHVESVTLVKGRSEQDAHEALGALTLDEVRRILDSLTQ